MKTEKIALSRKFNLGNYQTLNVHMEASVYDGENAIAALHKLEQMIMMFWDQRIRQQPIRVPRQEGST